MMETLEQQKAKSTPNIEPDAGDTTRTSPAAASEEEDNCEEEHNNGTFQLEEEEKNEDDNSQKFKITKKINENIKGTHKKLNSDPNLLNGSNATEETAKEAFETASINSIKIEDNVEQELPEPMTVEIKPGNSNFPVIKIEDDEEENCSPEEKNGNKTASIDIKIEEKSPVSVAEEEEENEEEGEETNCRPPVIKIVEETSSHEFRIDAESSQDESALSTAEERSEDNKRPVLRTYNSPVEEMETTQSPVYKIDDLSPASIPADDESELEFDTLPKVELKSPMEIIKIESDSEDETVEVERIEKEADIKVKINGAHTAMLVEQDQEREKPMQLSVIANNNNAGNESVEEEETDKQDNSTTRRRSSRSSTISSTSRQLVIDHPESEQLVKRSGVEQVQQQMLQATKRRRSGSNSDNEMPKQAKQKCIEEQTSLLLQRLQAPVTSSNDMDPNFSYNKCNLQNFENVQQLKELSSAAGIREVAEASVVPTVKEKAAPTVAVYPSSNITPTVALSIINPAPPPLKKERFFRCARCSTVHQCWNFFLHMREVHQRYICLYCSHVFASVEKLSLHLENKHDMDQRHFNNVQAWQTLQTLEDRARYLVCCNCQATFARGSHFDDHDCTELMQPCALCGQKGGHANDCRNVSTRKKTAARRKRKITKSKQSLGAQSEEQTTTQELPNCMEGGENKMQQQQLSQTGSLFENNIPAATNDAPQEALPKLVVPKIMLRVPKEFQKSVDAALSSTDTEDEENDEMPSTADRSSPTPQLLTVDAVQQQQQQQEDTLLPTTSLSEDTETATETASMFTETPMPAGGSMEQEDGDSPDSKLTRVLAEFERTKLDIQKTRAHIMAKKENQLQQEQQEEPMEQDEEDQTQQSRWSPTPPASPHNNNHLSEETQVPKGQQVDQDDEQQQQQLPTHMDPMSEPVPLMQRRDTLGSECMDIDDSLNEEHQRIQEPEQEILTPSPPADGIEVAGAETHTMDLQLDRPLDKFELVDFVRLCLKSVYPFCIYCNHARRIAVNAKQLVLHLIGQHRFTATVDSITAEELHAETIVSRLKSYLPVLEGGHYLNSVSCCSLEPERFVQPFNERIYECFQCRYVTATHKELYTHNRRLHIKTNITCCMCLLNFFSYSELLCHICPGSSTGNVFDIQFRCCLCEVAPLPSAFRLMVHLRRQHQACDICLEDCHTQAKLSAHVWKHKLLHLCYRCGIAYRNKQDISKHLFWKHGTESTSCKRCLQKRWRHVYHFCVPATQFICDQCQFSFSKAIYLEVHKRQHAHDFRYACNEEDCDEKFVSRKLLLKHAVQHESKELVLVHEPAKEEKPTLEQEQEQELKQLEGNKAIETQTKVEAAAEQPHIDNQLVAGGSHQKQQKAESPETMEKPHQTQQQTPPRKRRKKAKRNKASLEDLNLIAPNLSESDSSEDSDSDAPRSTGAQQEFLPMRASVDDLDMPRVMLSPSSESDNEDEKGKQLKQEAEARTEQLKSKQEQETAVDAEHKPKLENESDAQEVPDIWKNLLQHGKTETEIEPQPQLEMEPIAEKLRPVKLHVAFSDHDYCKLQRTPPPTPAPLPKKSVHATPNKVKRGNDSSDSDSSSSSSSNSDSDSSSCSCGSNCSCSSSGSSSSDDDSDNDSQSSARKKKITEQQKPHQHNEEQFINVTSINEEEPRPITPVAKAPLYNESDFDTAISDTDEEFYDAHPQKLASEMLAQKRLALLSTHSEQQPPGGGNYDIVENSRPSTPSLPEEAAAYEDKRERISKTKKRKRERKSTCKSTSQAKLATPLMVTPQQHLLTHQLNPYNDSPSTVSGPPHQLLESPITPLTHRPTWQPRMSEGSSCSDADGQLKRSKRQRRPNKFYGYTSDDENMSSVLAPPLQVGMQLIKPQPPPQLTWAKEDLPTPPKQQRSRSNHHDHQSSHHQHPHQHSNGSTRKRNRRAPQSGGSGGSAKRSTKRVRQQLTPAPPPEQEQHLPPIPTLKIRPALLPLSVAPSESSDSSSDDDEQAEINVTSLLPIHQPMLAAPIVALNPAPLPVAVAQPPPPPPATTAFNQPIPPALLPNPDFATLQYFKANNIRYPIRPPAGARLAREGESVYCYCRCPYDEVSEMIACDGDNCLIEWFHFECVGIMVAPQGKWFCAECRPKYSEGLYPGVKAK